ncbi:MAG: bifunctional 2',3'-cyclic-nucleotide 2'-phosphodiesterase/3'-nucleotidase [Gemmobacter sp.]
MIQAKPFTAAALADQVHLRILETTDLHVHLLPFDYFRNRPTPVLGLARTAGLIEVLRAEVANCLLFDNGDFLQGSPMGDYMALARGLRPGDLHPMIAAMNRLGYDAATLGNHEFNFGLDFLRNALSRAAFPVVAANLAATAGTASAAEGAIFPRWTILDRQVRDGTGKTHRLRLGVIGLLPPQTGIWDREHLEGRVTLGDMVDTAAAVVPLVRQAGADLVVTLAHTGIGEADHFPGMENAAIPLARIHGLDVLLLGHAHQVFPSAAFAGLEGVDIARGTIAGTPAVMAGCFGSHVGVIDLMLRREPRGWHITASQASACPIARPGPDGKFVARTRSQPDIEQTATEVHDATRRYMARAVGFTPLPLTTHLALVGDCAAVRVVAMAKADHIRRALKDSIHADLPVLGSSAPVKAGGRGGPINYTEIPAGRLALRHMADLYLFPNQVRGLRLTGADLAEWLERAASIYLKVRHGVTDQPLIDPGFPSYNFDAITGVSYAIDPTSPPRYDTRGVLVDAGARRVRGLSWEGRAVRPDDTFIVATSSYRLSTLRATAGVADDDVVYASPRMGRDVLTDWFLAGNLPEAATAEDGWRLVLPAATSVTFDTSPRLRPGGAQLAGAVLTDLGITPDGFRRVRLTGGGTSTG